MWVADITYIAIAVGFAYLAAILDAWSRRVVGYAISRSMDARLAVAALTGAVLARQPPTPYPDTDQVARDIISAGERMQGLARDELLRDLSFELIAVRAVLAMALIL